jgi:hypothetical protein
VDDPIVARIEREAGVPGLSRARAAATRPADVLRR